MKQTIKVRQINLETGEEVEVEEVMEIIEPTEEEIIAQKVQEANAYLASTAWYIERFNDPSSGKEVPAEVLAKRAEAREFISNNKGAI